MHRPACRAAVLAALLLAGPAAAADRPNIVFCFADDWGRSRR